MEKMKELLLVIRGFKGWVLVLMFISGFLWLFNKPIINYTETALAKDDLVLGNIQNDVLINNALNDLMLDTKADRAYIFRFHNGITYYTGTHKARMSCDYEVVRRGISSEAQRLQNLPTALYVDWLSEVVSNRMIHPDVNNVQDARARQMLIQQGIKGIAVMPYYRDGNLISLIGIDYVTYSGKGIDFSKIKGAQIFKERTQKIGDLLI